MCIRDRPKIPEAEFGGPEHPLFPDAVPAVPITASPRASQLPVPRPTWVETPLGTIREGLRPTDISLDQVSMNPAGPSSMLEASV